MRRYVQTATLVDDPDSIAAYERWHEDVWPEVVADNLAAGVRQFTIHRRGTTLVLVLDVEDRFSPESYSLPSERSREWLAIMDGLVVEQADGARWLPLAEICRQPSPSTAEASR